MHIVLWCITAVGTDVEFVRQKEMTELQYVNSFLNAFSFSKPHFHKNKLPYFSDGIDHFCITVYIFGSVPNKHVFFRYYEDVFARLDHLCSTTVLDNVVSLIFYP